MYMYRTIQPTKPCHFKPNMMINLSGSFLDVPVPDTHIVVQTSPVIGQSVAYTPISPTYVGSRPL